MARPPKKPVIKPTTMRIDPELLRKVGAVGRKKYDRSRSWLIAKYITDGLKADGAIRPAPPAEGTFA